MARNCGEDRTASIAARDGETARPVFSERKAASRVSSSVKDAST
jgi:hypothetical protein